MIESQSAQIKYVLCRVAILRGNEFDFLRVLISNAEDDDSVFVQGYRAIHAVNEFTRNDCAFWNGNMKSNEIAVLFVARICLIACNVFQSTSDSTVRDSDIGL